MAATGLEPGMEKSEVKLIACSLSYVETRLKSCPLLLNLSVVSSLVQSNLIITLSLGSIETDHVIK